MAKKKPETKKMKMKGKGDIEESLKIGSMEIRLSISNRLKILFMTIGISLGIIIVGFLVSGKEEFTGVFANLIILSTFIMAVPQFLISYQEYRAIKEMEAKFPTFLRDIIESLSAGLPLHKAILNVSKLDYGKFSVELRKAANQITWGIPVNRVLNQFADRVKRSKRMFTSLKLINESYTSGGDVISILNTVADNSNLLEDAEKERQSLLSQYVLLMYAISIMFIVIVVAISKLIMPIFSQTAGSEEASEMIGLGNPCDNCMGFECVPCSLYEGTSYYLFSIDPDNISAYYVSLFFYMSVMQAIFSGLVAGQIGDNSVTAGVKHSLIMVSITIGTFYFLIYFNILG